MKQLQCYNVMMGVKRNISSENIILFTTRIEFREYGSERPCFASVNQSKSMLSSFPHFTEIKFENGNKTF